MPQGPNPDFYFYSSYFPGVLRKEEPIYIETGIHVD
jgi:hypothetical protein